MTHEEIYKEVAESLDLTEIQAAIAVHELNRYREYVLSEIATVDDLIEYVCKLRGVTKESVVGRSRRRKIAEARQIIWFLIKNRVVGKHLSSIEMGSLFYRDHSTALWGIEKVKSVITYDGEIRDEIMKIANHFGKSATWDPILKTLTFSTSDETEV